MGSDKLSNVGIEGERIEVSSKKFGSPSMAALDFHPCILPDVLYGNKDAF
jgi:hypothetical protein